MRQRQGFSLLDLIVSIFLGSLVTYILALFLTGVARQYFSINEKLNLHSQALSFRDNISRRLRHTTPHALLISADGHRFGFQTFSGIEPPHKIQWSKQHVFVAVNQANQTIHLWSLPASSLGLAGTDTTHPQLPSPQSLESLSPPAQTSPKHLLWRHVTNFKAVLEGTQALRIVLTFEQIGVRRNRHRIDFNEIYHLTNDREL